MQFHIIFDGPNLGKVKTSLLWKVIPFTPENTRESDRYPKEQLLQRNGHRLAAAEFKYDFCYYERVQYHTYRCLYFIADRTKRELVVIGDRTKGYGGHGPAKALELDTYIDLMNIPILRTGFSSRLLEDSLRHNAADYERDLQTPVTRCPHFNLKNIKRIKARIRKAGYGECNLQCSKLNESMSLEEALNSIHFLYPN